jgi:hypothetical protein
MLWPTAATATQVVEIAVGSVAALETAAVMAIVEATILVAVTANEAATAPEGEGMDSTREAAKEAA